MKTIKIAEATPLQIDYLVAKVEGLKPEWDEIQEDYYLPEHMSPCFLRDFKPSTNPAQGQPILEREGISTRQYKPSLVSLFAERHFDASKGDVLFDDPVRKCKMVRRTNKPGPLYGMWLAQPLSHGDSTVHWKKTDFPSPTMLIAGLRCFLVSRLGEEADIPEDLV